MIDRWWLLTIRSANCAECITSFGCRLVVQGNRQVCRIGGAFISGVRNLKSRSRDGQLALHRNNGPVAANRKGDESFWSNDLEVRGLIVGSILDGDDVAR